MVMLARKQLPVVLKLDLYSSFFFLGRMIPNDYDKAYFAGFI